MSVLKDIKSRFPALPKKAKTQVLEYQNWVIIASLVAISLIWIGVISPLQNSIYSLNQAIPNVKKELFALRELAGQIDYLEKKFTGNEETTTQEPKISLLKEVETLAKETKIFFKIGRFTPTQIQQGERSFKAISLELEGISLPEVTPFLHKISHESLLDIQNMSFRRTDESSGVMAVRMTIIDPHSTSE